MRTEATVANHATPTTANWTVIRTTICYCRARIFGKAEMLCNARTLQVTPEGTTETALNWRATSRTFSNRRGRSGTMPRLWAGIILTAGFWATRWWVASRSPSGHSNPCAAARDARRGRGRGEAPKYLSPSQRENIQRHLSERQEFGIGELAKDLWFCSAGSKNEYFEIRDRASSGRGRSPAWLCWFCTCPSPITTRFTIAAPVISIWTAISTISITSHWRTGLLENCAWL